MQTVIALLWLLGVLSCIGAFAGGVCLLVAGLTSRSGHDPHCPKCDYNLTGVAASVCPECGTAYLPVAAICGERRRRPTLLVAGTILCLLALVSGEAIRVAILNGRASRTPSTPSGSILYVKGLIHDLKDTFTRGQTLIVDPDGKHVDDRRMGMLGHFLVSRLPMQVERGVTNPTIRAEALRILSSVRGLLEAQVLPAWSK